MTSEYGFEIPVGKCKHCGSRVVYRCWYEVESYAEEEHSCKYGPFREVVCPQCGALRFDQLEPDGCIQRDPELMQMLKDVCVNGKLCMWWEFGAKEEEQNAGASS